MNYVKLVISKEMKKIIIVYHVIKDILNIPLVQENFLIVFENVNIHIISQILDCIKVQQLLNAH